MIRRLYATDDNTATSILRVVLGIVFFAHGAQKMLGWFGGPGLSGTTEYFTGAMHIPVTLAFVEIAAEFFGAIALIPGILTRIAAFARPVQPDQDRKSTENVWKPHTLNSETPYCGPL
jgi:putative oxidoreductase